MNHAYRMAEFVEAYHVSFPEHGGTELRNWCEQWPEPDSRGELLRNLLHVEVEQHQWNITWLQTRFREFAVELANESERMAVLRDVACDAIECGAPVTWSDLQAFGFSSTALDVRIPGDTFALGQCVQQRYVIEERIGSGRFGVVYQALDQELLRIVALKTVIAGQGIAPAVVRRLLHEEATLLQRLSVKGLPLFYERYDDPVAPLFAMEFIAGRTLRSALRGREWAWVEGVCLVRKLAEIVHRVHQYRLIHRDIKPENIILTDAGEPYLTDFGIALTEQTQFAQALPARAGTRAYMAPEALVGLERQLDARTDVWSLGAIFYELLTGERVVDDESLEAALVSSVVAGSHELEFPDHVPDIIRAVVRRCLAREPHQRFDSAAALANVLQQIETEPLEIPETRRGRRLAAWRIGMKLGSAIECHALYRKFLQQAEQAGTATPDQSQNNSLLRRALGYVNGPFALTAGH